MGSAERREFAHFLARNRAVAPIASHLSDAIFSVKFEYYSEESLRNLASVNEYIAQGYSVVLVANHTSHLDVPYIQTVIDNFYRPQGKKLEQTWFGNMNLNPHFFDQHVDNDAVRDYLPIHLSNTKLPENAVMNHYVRRHHINILHIAQPKDVAPQNTSIPEKIKEIINKISFPKLKTALTLLEKQQILLGIFPEGGRSDTGKLQRAQDILSKIIHRMPEKTIILPLAIDGTDNVYPKEGHLVNFVAPVSVEILSPIPVSSLHKDTQAIHTVMKTIAWALPDWRAGDYAA